MSKFIKFIVHFVVIAVIACVLAIAVPLAAGIKTTIIDDSYTDTNMLKGSVTYSEETEASQLKLGDDIVVEEGNSVRRYKVIQVDLTNQTCLVKDAALAGDVTQTISINNGVYKTLFVVEYIGYLLIATESKEGMVILGIAALILIILYIIAELWKKGSAADDDYGDYAELKSPKELKREEKRTEAIRKAEEKQLMQEQKNEKKAKKRQKKNKQTRRTGGFIDEIDVEDEKTYAEEEKQPSVMQQAATTEAHEELKKEIAAATADTKKIEDQTIDLHTAAVDETVTKGNDALKEKQKEQEIAIPIYTAKELAQKAKEAGDNPDVMKDDVSDIVLFDYSDVITEEEK